MKRGAVPTLYSVLFWMAVLVVFFWIVYTIVKGMLPAGGGA